MGIPDDDFDSGDALFEDVDEDDLIFDGIEEEDLIGKTTGKHSRGIENDNVPVKKARVGSVSTTDGKLGGTQRIQIAQRILADKFRYKSFRHEQEAAISRLLNGDSALVVFPTGAGKSLCYQVCIASTHCKGLLADTHSDSCHRFPRGGQIDKRATCRRFRHHNCRLPTDCFDERSSRRTQAKGNCCGMHGFNEDLG